MALLYLLFLILIIINPFYIYNLGFIYSFTTSFGLILFSNKITGNYIIQLIKISTIAFMFSLPITIYNFYEINLLTILNNIIIVPFVTIFSSLNLPVPNVSTHIDVGCATPIAYESWISHLSAIPAATKFLAT